MLCFRGEWATACIDSPKCRIWWGFIQVKRLYFLKKVRLASELIMSFYIAENTVKYTLKSKHNALIEHTKCLLNNLLNIASIQSFKRR